MADKNPVVLAIAHDQLLFRRAYPRTPQALRRAELLLKGFARRMKGVDPLLGSDVSGIAGTAVNLVFSFDFVRWLAGRFPRQVDIDWDLPPDPDRLAAVLTPLIPMLAEEVVDADVPYFEMLRARGLPWLLDNVDAAAYDSLGLWILWKFGASLSRTRMRRKPSTIFYQRGPMLTRREVSIEHELASPSMPVRKLSRREGERVLEMARAALATRYRELYAFTWGDPSTISSADAGRGLEILLIGIVPGKRLPLRAGFAPFVFHNGVPIGYGDAFGLCERMDVSFNIFYGFREGESAYAFARLLKLYHQLFGSKVFSIDPYQIGIGNDEAIEAGAYWFYRKLGFRSTDPQVERMALREEQRMNKDSRHRTSQSMLRRLARSPMAWGNRDWDRFRIHKVVEKGFSLPADLKREKRGRFEREYLLMIARNERIRRELLRLGS